MSTSKVSANLRSILDMADRLEARAIDEATRGDRLGSAPLGGEAMVNLGPVADPSKWERRNELAGDALVAYEDPDELWSSYQTLRFWSEQWREDLGMDHDDPTWRPSLRSEAAFLMNPDVLNWAWGNEPHWDEYAADVKAARRKLEDVVHEGTRAEMIRVTCTDCETIDDETGEAKPGPRLMLVYGETRDEDRWKCPECKHRFDAEHVRRAGANQAKRSGVAQRWVTFADALAILRERGWREKTIRTWAHNATEVSRDDSGPTPRYWWPDLWRCHLMHRWEVNENRKKAEDRARRKANCVRDHGEDCWRHGRGCSVVLAERAAV